LGEEKVSCKRYYVHGTLQRHILP